MNQSEREWLRAVASQNVFPVDRSSEVSGNEGQSLIVEHLTSNDWHRTRVVLTIQKSEGVFKRSEAIAVPRSYGQILAEKNDLPRDLAPERRGLSWEGRVNCSSDAIRRSFKILTALGLWELGDFRPAVELMGGEYLIVQAIDPENRFEIDASVFCLGESVNPLNRKLASELHGLLNLSIKDLMRRPWRGKLLG